MPVTAANREFLDPTVLARLGGLQVLPRGLVQGSFTGMHRSPHRGASVEFAEYRKYVPGDDIRHIDWRVYGRSDRFYLKEFEADTNMRCHLVLDCSASMGFTGKHGSKLAYARKLAATLAYLIIRQGDHVGLQTFNDKVLEDIRPRANPAHLAQIFDSLSKLKPAGGSSVVKVLHELAATIRRRALVVVFSDFFTDVPALLDCFRHMRHRHHDLAVFHLLDRNEVDFQFDRPIRFTDLEGPTALVTDPNVIRPAYLAALQQYRAQLTRGCGEHGVDYEFVTLDQPYDEVLAEFILERLRRQR